jgi:hypothetical protein
MVPPNALMPIYIIIFDGTYIGPYIQVVTLKLQIGQYIVSISFFILLCIHVGLPRNIDIRAIPLSICISLGGRGGGGGRCTATEQH